MGKFNVIAVVIGVFLVALMIGRYWNLKPETKLDHVVHRGETAVAAAQGTNVVWVAAEAGLAYGLHAAALRGDEAVLKQAVAESKAFPLEAGAQVRVAGDSGSKRRIEVLTGPNTGKTGWVEFECLRPIQRGELREAAVKRF